MSTGWQDYDPAPIEQFHGEAMDEFHRRRKELGKGPHEGLNGIDVNNIIAEFKMKIKRAYGISSEPVLKKKPDDEPVCGAV